MSRKTRLFAIVLATLVSGPLNVLAHEEMHMQPAGVGMAMPAEGIVVDVAWSPETPPGAMSAAIYLKLNNMSGMEKAIVGAASPDFAMAHIHRTSVVDGVASMEMIEHLAVPAGKAVEFTPGGLHIMLMSPSKRAVAGETIPVTLYFDDGTSLDFEAVVMKRSEGMAAGKMNM